VETPPKPWVKNGVAQYNAIGLGICVITLIVLYGAKSPGTFAKSPLLSEYPPLVSALMASSPFFLIGLSLLLSYSRITVDPVAGVITRRSGIVPFLRTKRYPLDHVKYIEIDVGRGTYTADFVFEDLPRVNITPGDSELGIEKVLELIDQTHIPLKPTANLVKFNPLWFKKSEGQRKILL